MRSPKAAPGCNHTPDDMMLAVSTMLIRDFRRNLVDPSFCSSYELDLLSRNMERIRQNVPAIDEEMDVARFKATYQIQSILKRYRFSKDLYSDEELTEKAINSFRETQDRIAKIRLDDLPANVQCVLDGAAVYIANVLGVYDDEECRSQCRFGRKASVGIPARMACEAARWELPLTGARDQIDWFDSEMSQITSVQDYWAAQKAVCPEKDATYQLIESLKLTLVPKTFKSFRAIMPNTTVGSYMSYGLGIMIRDRLKSEGYNIATLQQRHRLLAQRASGNSQYVTADLSSASDSISTALVQRLFPPDWFEILNQSRIGTVELPDKSLCRSETFCTMGIGFTFPLQTLVFLALLKSIESIMYDRLDRRTISVYGDDLIYHRRMHEEVLYFFEAIGFVINVDKTFATGHFRESCGGDFFHKVDVRPFQPRNGAITMSPRAREAVLYKCINGLLMRWSEYEIEETLAYLCRQIEILVGSVKLVPADYPDDAGVKVSDFHSQWFLRDVSVAKPVHVGDGRFRFSYLRFDSVLREENRHEPFYWVALRGRSEPVFDYADPGAHRSRPSDVESRINRLTGSDLGTEQLVTQLVRPIITYRSKLTGRRLRRTITMVAVSHSGKYTRQSGISCFGIRR